MKKEEYMSKDELKELLKENLEIGLSEDWRCGTKYLAVTVTFDGEEICCDEYGYGTYDDYGY